MINTNCQLHRIENHLCTSGHACEGSIKKTQYFLKNNVFFENFMNAYNVFNYIYFPFISSPQTLPRSSATSLSLFYVLIFLSNSQSPVCAAHRYPLKHSQPIKDDIPKENLPFTSTHQLSVAPQLVV